MGEKVDGLRVRNGEMVRMRKRVKGGKKREGVGLKVEKS